MPTTNARKHVIPSSTETSVTRATIFQAALESVRDIVPVANTTARAQLVTDLSAAGVAQAPSSTKPLVVYRHDAPGLHKLEWTTDGTVWVPSTGVLQFASVSAMNSWTTSNSGYLVAGDQCTVGADAFVWNGTAWTLPGGLTRRSRTTALNLTSSTTVIDWATADTAPTVADFTYASGVFTAVAAGRFRVHAQVTFATAGSAVGTQIAVRVGATDEASSDIVTSTAGGVTNHVHRDITLAAGGTFQIQGSAGSTVGLAVAFPRQCFVEIVRI